MRLGRLRRNAAGSGVTVQHGTGAYAGTAGQGGGVYNNSGKTKLGGTALSGNTPDDCAGNGCPG